MYNGKIDSRLISKIKSLDCKNNCIDILVYCDDITKAKRYLNDIDNGCIIDLPIISALGITTKLGAITRMCECENIKYISDSVKVCSQIYNSKKFIGASSISVRPSNHTCVVIDTGVYPHIDFCLGRNRIKKFIDLINNEVDMYDDNGHGTFVCGILAGNSVTSKYTGLDYMSDLIVIKALNSDGETTSLKILEAMQWVIDNKDKYNIKVVCMSFGSAVVESRDPLVYGAEVLWDNGITVISAGGNSGPDSETIMSPGVSRKIITVGSLDSIKADKIEVADFSSRGPAFNFYKPDIVVPGVEIISTSVFDKKKNFYTKMSGTSVSTPMVAGVASLLYSINPNYMPDQIKYMLIKSCVPITGDRNAEGYGYLNLRKLKIL